jgi:hypothetical protein
MRKVQQILSTLSILVATYEIYKGRTDGAILFTLWSFYLKYSSDRPE